MRKIKDQILKLHAEGFNYDQIAEKLNCSKGAISYHLGNGQKEKSKNRLRKNRSKNHPYSRKLEAFLATTINPTSKKQIHRMKKLIQLKLESFFRQDRRIFVKPTITVEQVIAKFGENPKCYLTGEPIDISQPRTYAFDHIIPRSRGGENTLENLGLTTKLANAAKTDMTYEEFIKFCQRVVENNKLAN